MKIVIEEEVQEPTWPRLYVTKSVMGDLYLVDRLNRCGGATPHVYICTDLRTGIAAERNTISDLRPLPSGSTVKLTQD